jgi:hypothetical protein
MTRLAMRDLGRWRWTVVSMAAVLAFLAQFVRVGADWDWLVALGDRVRALGAVPDGVPFASADTSGWHNVPVLAELLASVVHDAGERASVVLHLVLVGLTLAIIARAARVRGAGDAYVAGALGLLGVGGLATLGVLRAQTLSLVPFALMIALVVAQARRPDRRVWWAVPLVVVWANLHGAALLGVCVLGAYLLMDRLRRRPAETVAVGVASLLALCVTPELWRTPLYYAEVFDNVSAQRGDGLWARPSLTMPFDVVMLVAVLVLLLLFLRSRRQLWEYVAVLGLCAATASAARHGTWLLLLLVVLASRRGSRTDDEEPTSASSHGLGAAVTCAVAVALAVPLVLVRGGAVLGASPTLVASVQRVAGDGVVLAPAPLSESLAVAGVTLWASNPLDAFSHADQAAYLDFLDGAPGAGPAIDGADVVVVEDGSDQADLVGGDTGFESVACSSGWTCFVRR